MTSLQHLTVFVATFFLAFSAWATPVNMNGQGVSERDFYAVTKTIQQLYAPWVKAQYNTTLAIEALWDDSTVNAYASREKQVWKVHVAGGMARSQGMTKDALALVVCHELGHHLGGAPRTYLYEGWPSAEGQADYWATSKCLKKYYGALNSEDVPLDQNIPQMMIGDCGLVYKDFKEMKICIRSMMASLDFAHFLNSLPGVKTPISFTAKDPKKVKGTNTNDYPRPQCRFDTLYQGALCPLSSDVATSQTDDKIGHCNDGSQPGSRPRCWYAP